MPLPKKIVIVAGEASGDAHAATLVSHLLQKDPSMIVSGVGGKKMQASGVSLLMDLAHSSVTGFTEIICHLHVIWRAFSLLKKHLKKEKPDLLILVDYPGFNLRLATIAKKLGIRTLYYISPQIWAWKAKRIQHIKQVVDRMAVILPFEKSLYETAKVPVSFVGHPLIHQLVSKDEVIRLQKALKLSNHEKIVALLPGSRRNEVKRHFPIMLRAALLLSQTVKNLHWVIPVADTLKPELLDFYLKDLPLSYSLVFEKAQAVMALSDCVVVASGTASLECALLQKPMCIIYKTSLLTYIIATRVMKVRYIGLCNLLQNKMMVPELLQDDCNPHELKKILLQLLTNISWTEKMQKALAETTLLLSSNQADCSIDDLVMSELSKNSLDMPLNFEIE